ncbi:MAG: AAA family ATPase [Motiliproteus sp.]
MYSNYFGLTEPPFSLAPDPRYLYLSEQHREALAHLLYGIGCNGGFVLLTGEVGTGKTTVCRCLLEQLPENTDLAVILNPKFTVLELLAAVCDELEAPYESSENRVKTYVDAINTHLLQAHALGRNTVLIIDEAQNLSVDVLEQVRLLTNLETSKRKLLQIVLLGQPELLEKLSRPELRQLEQRITARHHLTALSQAELGAYVSHRLSVAGLEGQLFPPSTLKRLYRLTGGVPRLINILCDRALLGTFVQRDTRVEVPTLVKAAKEVYGDKHQYRPKPLSYLKWGVGGATLAGLSTFLLFSLNAMGFFNQPVSNVEESTQAHIIASQSQSQSVVVNPLVEATVSGAVKATKMPEMEISNPANWRWPEDADLALSKVTAYQSLFKAWGIDYAPREHPTVCRFSRSLGLGCLSLHGDMDELRQLNRPAVLKLFNAQGQEYYVTLLSTEGERGVVEVGGQRKEVHLKDLELWWLRTYTLLWRQPPGYDTPIRPGASGQTVAWLDQQLSFLQGRAPLPEGELTYDGSLIRQVQQFQRSQGLTADAVVGPQTSIHLNTATAEDVPQLIVNPQS